MVKIFHFGRFDIGMLAKTFVILDRMPDADIP